MSCRGVEQVTGTCPATLSGVFNSEVPTLDDGKSVDG